MKGTQTPAGVGPGLTPDEARALTDEIRGRMEDIAPLVTRAFEGQAWKALGYDSWAEYVAGEFGGPLRLGREDRQQVVTELRRAGLSTRAIGTALGVSHPTVMADIGATGKDLPDLPATVTGLDGRERAATRPEPEPLTQQEQREHERLVASVAAEEWFITLEVALETLREAKTWAVGVRLTNRKPEHVAAVRALVNEAAEIVAFIEEKVR